MSDAVLVYVYVSKLGVFDINLNRNLLMGYGFTYVSKLGIFFYRTVRDCERENVQFYPFSFFRNIGLA